tara:strand:- start:1080 stop:1535 length:456 start_codon:yes stop_codon:yes gene_type:complete
MSLLDYSQKETIKLPLYYTFKNTKYVGRKLVVLDNAEAEKMLEDEDQKDSVNILNTEWEQVDWGKQKEIISQSVKQITNPVDGSIQEDFDHEKYRDLRINSCLKRWDETDPSGEEVPVSEMNIRRMPPAIIVALYNKFEEAISLTSDEMGN